MWAKARVGSNPTSRISAGQRGERSPLESPASPPLSSRGLGRRILSPETRVRIPVAVPQKARKCGLLVPRKSSRHRRDQRRLNAWINSRQLRCRRLRKDVPLETDGERFRHIGRLARRLTGSRRPRAQAPEDHDHAMAGSTRDFVCAAELPGGDPDPQRTRSGLFDHGGPGVVLRRRRRRTDCLRAHRLRSGEAPGRPARLEIGGSYAEPGIYTVAAVAYSHRRCRPHERGDGHAQRHSRVKRLETRVEETPR
jgi:hypothetical protein